jgi:glycosyltransferase involved in cell wall biosynthesis
MKTTAVVPVYNEKPETLTSVLNELKNYVDEIVVVDDGSEINYQLPITRPTSPGRSPGGRANCQLLKHKINRGQGAALQTGTDYAVKHGADIIVHFDGDGQHSPEDIPDLIKPIQEGRAEFVFGSRFLGKKSNIPWTKKNIILPVSKIINRIFSGLKLTDVHNGLRAFSSKIVNKIYLTQDKMAHNTEYPYLVKKNKISYAEAPVKFNYHAYGQGIAGGIKILKELVTGKIIR